MTSAKPKIDQPLSHLRVLDLTQFLSGPYATQILGDLGADVIKVEAPAGDLTRSLPPYFVGADSAYYLSVNRNKRSIVIDLKTDRGLQLLRELALASEVVIENFRPGVLERLGFSYADISAQKPEIVWCSISGFGQDGPYRDRPAYDMIVQAMSGGMSLTGEEGGPPVRAGIPLGDIGAGMYGTIGILGALIDSQRTGKGRWIDVAMLDCQIATLSYQAAYYLHSGVTPGRQGRGHDSIPTYRSFPCRDDTEVVITANTEKMWRSLCAALEVRDVAEDPRFRTNLDRQQNRKILWPILEAAFKCHPAAHWVDTLLAQGIPAAEVNTLDKSLTDPQVLHRQMVAHLENSDGATARVAGNPIRFRGGGEMPARYPPPLGADQRNVLSSVLGMTDTEIDELAANQVIGPILEPVSHAQSRKESPNE